MRRHDFFVFSAWAIVLLAVLSPALFDSRRVLASFGDLFAYHYPMRHLAVGALQAGHLPFWNPYIFSGVPLAANSQAVLFYPVSLLGAFFPLTLALTWDYAFHWLWGGLGLFLLSRRAGLDAAGAILLAALFCLSPFLVYRIAEGIPTLLAALSWAPWCWLALFSGRPGFLAGVWALQFLSGHPQFMVINALGMAVWAAVGAERKALLGRFLREGLWALPLAVVQWAPTWEFLSHSVRGSWLASYTTAYSLTGSNFLTWLSPDALGNPLGATYADFPSVFFETCAVHIGVAGLLLAACGLFLGRGAGAAALIFFGIFLGLGGNNPLYLEALKAGVLGWLRTPARYSFLSLWGLILAAGAGAKIIQARFSPRWRYALALVAAAELLAWDAKFLKSEPAASYLGFNRAIAEAAGKKNLRVMTDPDLASANKTMLYRAMNVNGYEAFYLAGYPQYAARSEGRAAADASRTYLRRYDSPEMNRAGVAYFISVAGQLRPNPAARPLAYFARAQGSALEVSSPRPERWRVEGIAPGELSEHTLVLTQPYYPGWRAWINGAPVRIEKWDGFFQAVSLPRVLAGRGFEVRLHFEPSGWPFLAALSLLSWAFWLGRFGGALLV